MRGGGTWALLYPSEFAYANGAEVLKDGKVVINSKKRSRLSTWYLDLPLKHKVAPPSASTDGFVDIVEGFGRGITSMYQHNSGSSGQQKKNVGAGNSPRCRCRSARRRSARPSSSPRRSPRSRVAEQGRRVAVHELHARGRAQPHVLQDAGSFAGAQVHPLDSRSFPTIRRWPAS